MTNEEWITKSDDWHKGWRCGQGDDTIKKRDSEDFIDGYMYALEHPIGSISVPM